MFDTNENTADPAVKAHDAMRVAEAEFISIDESRVAKERYAAEQIYIDLSNDFWRTRATTPEGVRLKIEYALEDIGPQSGEQPSEGFWVLKAVLRDLDLMAVTPRSALRRRVPRIMRCHEVREVVGCTRSTLYRWMKAGKFPMRVKLPTGRIGWVEDEVRAWLQEQMNERLGRR